MTDLTDSQVRSFVRKGAGRKRVSKGLYLEVKAKGSARWVAILQAHDRRHE